MSSILILFSHPSFERSRTHIHLLQHVSNLPGVTVHDLYEAYPDFDINVKREQQLLLQHDIIIWQHPIYWYSCPALLKQWQDLVLEHGWAYGKDGKQLAGKIIFNVISTGGMQQAYSMEGFHRHTMREFILPFEQTAKLCLMDYWPPFVVHGTHRLMEADFISYAKQYRTLCEALLSGKIKSTEAHQVSYLNQLVTSSPIQNI